MGDTRIRKKRQQAPLKGVEGVKYTTNSKQKQNMPVCQRLRREEKNLSSEAHRTEESGMLLPDPTAPRPLGFTVRKIKTREGKPCIREKPKEAYVVKNRTTVKELVTT